MQLGYLLTRTNDLNTLKSLASLGERRQWSERRMSEWFSWRAGHFSVRD